MYYQIDTETFAISIFNDGEEIPFQYQPHYPNNDSFDSYEEAELWAQASIAAHDPEVLFYAPNGKGLDPEPKPTQEEIAVRALQSIGLDVNTLKSILGLN